MVIAALAGTLVLAGWALDIGLLKAVVPSQASMKPLTALGLLLGGLALWLQRETASGPRRRWLASICAGLTPALGAVILFEYLLGVDLGIDQVLFRQGLLAENVLPIGRPAPATALCLLLLGLALLALDSRPA